MRFGLLLGAIWLAGCSSPQPAKTANAAPPAAGHMTASNTSNPAAKYVELVGFRLSEKGAGHLLVQFAAVNHSEADLGDLKLTVKMRTTTAKPGDAPLFTFSVKVPSLGPSEMKQLSATAPVQMRVYELPDWQFLKADFTIDDAQ